MPYNLLKTGSVFDPSTAEIIRAMQKQNELRESGGLVQYAPTDTSAIETLRQLGATGSQLEGYSGLQTQPTRSIAASSAMKTPEETQRAINETMDSLPSKTKMTTSQSDSLMSQLEKQVMEGIKQREQGMADKQKLQASLAKSATPQLDISPFLAWIDSRTGSQLQKGYKPSTKFDEQMSEVERLQQAIDSGEKSISQDQISLIKSKLSGQEKRDFTLGVKDMKFIRDIDRAHNMEGRSAQPLKKMYDDSVKIDRGLDVIDMAKKGEIILDNTNASDLSASLTSLIVGGKPPQELVEATKYKTGRGLIASAVQWASANPQEYYSSDILNEVKKQFKRYDSQAKHRLSQFHSQIFNRARNIGIHKRNPEYRENQLRQFGFMFNIDPKTGDAISRPYDNPFSFRNPSDQKARDLARERADSAGELTRTPQVGHDLVKQEMIRRGRL